MSFEKNDFLSKLSVIIEEDSEDLGRNFGIKQKINPDAQEIWIQRRRCIQKTYSQRRQI